jgi:hypothetical protein
MPNFILHLKALQKSVAEGHQQVKHVRTSLVRFAVCAIDTMDRRVRLARRATRPQDDTR